MTELPVLGEQVGAHLKSIAESCGTCGGIFDQNQGDIGDICTLLIQELHRQRLAFSEDWFLTAQGEEIQGSIQDEFLRALPAQYE